MDKQGPSFGRYAAMGIFTLGCFGILLFLWVAFGGTIPLKAQKYEIKATFPEAATLAAQPAAGQIIGLSNILNTPGLCGGDASETPGGPIVPGLPIGPPKGEGIKRNGKSKSSGATELGGRPQADSPKKSGEGK